MHEPVLRKEILVEALPHQQAQNDLTEAILIGRDHFEETDTH